MLSLRLWIQPVTNNRKGYIMKRSGLSFVLLSLGLSLFAQNVKMPALIDSIHNLSMPIKVLGYGGGSGKTWSGFNKTDRLDDGSVRDRYSNTTRYFTPNNGDVSGMNIEHIFFLIFLPLYYIFYLSFFSFFFNIYLIIYF